MKKLPILLLILSLSTSPLISCSRVQKPGELKTVKLTKPDSIPMEYGTLISVTANPGAPRWAQLWFEDEEGTIRTVTVGFFDKIIYEKATVIPRN